MDSRLESVDKILAVIDTDDNDDTEKELAFAILAVDVNHAATLNWLAALAVKRAAELEGE